jgi:hypothetical protein
VVDPAPNRSWSAWARARARPEWFTTAYVHRQDKLGRELEEGDFSVEEEDRRQVLLRAIRRAEGETSLLEHAPAFWRSVACASGLGPAYSARITRPAGVSSTKCEASPSR